MKFFLATLGFFALLMLGMFGGLFGSNPGLMTISCMGLAIIGNPLLWVAIYRLFSGAAGARLSIRWEATTNQQPIIRSKKARGLVEELSQP